MKTLARNIVTAIAIFVAGDGIAQENTNTDTNATEEQSQKPADITTYSDWGVICEENNQCRMSQAIVQPEDRQLIVQMRIFKGADPTAVLTFPLGIFLGSGWKYDVDGKNETVLPFEICNADGCHVGIKLEPELVSALKGGNKMNITFRDGTQNEVTPTISLSGFTKAYESFE